MKKLPFKHEEKRTSDACNIDLEKFSEKMESLDEKIHDAGGRDKPSIEVEVIENLLTHRELAYLVVMMKMQQIEELAEKYRSMKDSEDEEREDAKEFL